MSCKNSLPGEHLRSSGEIALNQWYSAGEQLAVSGRWALADIHLRPFKAIRRFMRFPVVLATGIVGPAILRKSKESSSYAA